MGAKLLSLIVLALCLWQGSVAAQSIVNDLRFAQLEAELTFWGNERYMPTDATRQRTSEGVTTLTATNPSNADYHVLHAVQQSWEAYWAPDSTTRTSHQQAAINAYTQALHSRPAHAQTWQMMLEYAQLIGDEAAVSTAENQLQKLIP